jgi:hypothetical protein
MGFVSHFVDELRRRGSALRGLLEPELRAATTLNNEDVARGAFREQWRSVAEVEKEYSRELQPSSCVVLLTDEEIAHLQDVLWSWAHLW